MATGNVRIINEAGTQGSSWVFRTQASATQIQPGEPVTVSGNYVIPCATTYPRIADTYLTGMVGIAATQSPTAAAAVDGTVEVNLCLPGIVYACKTKLATTINTDAKLLTFLNTNVEFDLTSTVYTIDTANASTGGAGGLRIVGGDITNGIIYFIVHAVNTYFA